MRSGAACGQGLRTRRSMRIHFLLSALEIATAQRTRPRAVIGTPRRAAWQLKSVLRHSVSTAPRTIIFYIFFTISAGKLFQYVQQWLVMIKGGVEDTSLEAKDTKKFQGQGQTLSRPRTQTQVFSKKKGLQKFFSGDLYSMKPKKKCSQIFRKVSGIFQRNFNGSKIVLSSSRGQGNFRGPKASRPRTSKCVLEDSTSGHDATII